MQPLGEDGVVRPAPGLGEQDEEERRRVDRAVVAREPELGRAALAHLVDDLPGLRVDRRVVGLGLELGELLERADRDLGAEQERLERGDLRVAPEDGHEPRHSRGEQRPPVLARPHAQRARGRRSSGRTPAACSPSRRGRAARAASTRRRRRGASPAPRPGARRARPRRRCGARAAPRRSGPSARAGSARA